MRVVLLFFIYRFTWRSIKKQKLMKVLMMQEECISAAWSKVSLMLCYDVFCTHLSSLPALLCCSFHVSFHVIVNLSIKPLMYCMCQTRHKRISQDHTNDQQRFAQWHVSHIEDCSTSRVILSCASWHLQLNSDKTQVIWFGSKANLVKLKAIDCSLSVSSETVQPVHVVRDLVSFWTLSWRWSNTLTKWLQYATTNYGNCNKFVDVLDQKLQSSWCWHWLHLG